MVKQRSQRSERGGKGKGKEKGVKVKRGAWTAEEDSKLVSYVKAHGDKKWRQLPAKAGLNRCGRSCRLRWLNYLRPGIKRGNISEDEEDLIIRLHNLLGNRWSIIAGRIPGRTDNEIKNHWNTHLGKRSLTINDLNKKQNRTSESISATMPTSASPANYVNDDEMLGSWTELCGSEFDTEQYFRALLPTSDCYSTGIISDQFGILEDHGLQNHEICDFDKQNFWDNSLDNIRLFEFEDSNHQSAWTKPVRMDKSSPHGLHRPENSPKFMETCFLRQSFIRTPNQANQ